MRSFIAAAALAAVSSAAATELQMKNQAVVYVANKEQLAGTADFELTWEKTTTTTTKISMKNTFTWKSNSTLFKFDDLVGNGDVNKDELVFENCMIGVEYTTAAKKYMCFY